MIASVLELSQYGLVVFIKLLSTVGSLSCKFSFPLESRQTDAQLGNSLWPWF